MTTATRSKAATKNDKERKNNVTSKPNPGKHKSEEKSVAETSGQNNGTAMAANNKGKNKNQHTTLLAISL
eukprot:8673519-Ditylum_brightwellii.AAC.1